MNLKYEDYGMGEGGMTEEEAERYRARLQEMQEASRERVEAIREAAQKGDIDEA